MSRAARLGLGTLVTTAVIVGAAVLSAWPSWHTIPEGTAVVKLAFSHGGQRQCRQLTEAELEELPPNMRRREVCDRERPPVRVELEIDGETAFAGDLPPTGLAGDGPSQVYKSFVVPAGAHRLAVRLSDDPTKDGFEYTAERRVELAPAQNLAIDFAPEEGGFTFN